MIHSALYKLIGMQGRAAARKMLRGRRSLGKILIFVAGAALCITWLTAASLANAINHTDPNRVRALMPLVLLGVCIMTAITSAGDRAIAFTPGEVDQLFPGPFSRRELLAYKLLKSTLAAFLTAGVLSVVMRRHAQWWPASYVAVFFSLQFVQWFSIALLLVGQALGKSAYTRLRRFIIIAAGALVVVGASTWISFGAGGGWAAVSDFTSSLIGQVVLFPFIPFGRMMTAIGALDLLKWAALAALLNGGLVSLIFLLDAHYIETATAASERRYAKIKQVRAGGFLSLGMSKTSSWHLPQLPWAGGVGPIAWRQLTNAARSSRGVFLLLLIVAIGAAPALNVAWNGRKLIETMFGVLGWLTFLCANMLSFDFRGDVDHIEVLKSLPLSSWAVTVGQLVAPVAVLSTFHVVLLAISALVFHIHRDLLLTGLALSAPFNAILFGSENLIFLLFPSRPAAVSPGDFQVLGRKFVFFLSKLCILATACMVAFFAAWIAWELSRRYLYAAIAAGAMVLAVEAVALVPLIAWAYRRFDPSLHTPG